MFLYALPLYAQDVCEFKLYVDSLHEFSMEIPINQKIEQISYAKHRYVSKVSDKFQFKFLVQSKTNFLSTLRDNEKLDPADTLLSMAENKCYYSLKSKGDRAEGYGRIDSLLQWTNDYNIRVIEIHRTQVFKVFDGSFEYEKTGPLFLVNLAPAKADIFLSFDFYDYYNFEVINKIMSSIKVIQ
jgi:hypothetical protein